MIRPEDITGGDHHPDQAHAAQEVKDRAHHAKEQAKDAAHDTKEQAKETGSGILGGIKSALGLGKSEDEERNQERLERKFDDATGTGYRTEERSSVHTKTTEVIGNAGKGGIDTSKVKETSSSKWDEAERLTSEAQKQARVASGKAHETELLAEKIAEVEKEVSMAETKAQQLRREEEKVAAKAPKAGTTVDLGSVKADAQEHARILAQLREDARKAEESAQEKAEELNRIRAAYESRKRAVSKLQAEAGDLKDMARSKEDEEQARLEDLNHLRNRLRAARERESALNKQLENASAYIEDLERKLHNARADAKEKASALSDVRKEVKNAEKDLGKIQNAAEAAHFDAQEKRRQAVEKENELREKAAEAERAKANVQRLTGEVQDEINRAQGKLRQIPAEEAAYQEAERRLREAQERAEALERQAKAAEYEVSRLREEENDYEKTKVTLKNRADKLRAEYEQAKRDADEAARLKDDLWDSAKKAGDAADTRDSRVVGAKESRAERIIPSDTGAKRETYHEEAHSKYSERESYNKRSGDDEKLGAKTTTHSPGVVVGDIVDAKTKENIGERV